MRGYGEAGSQLPQVLAPRAFSFSEDWERAGMGTNRVDW